MPADGLGLPELLAPVDEQLFFSEYWEKKPLTIHRNLPAFYSSLFSLGAVDDILTASDLRLPAFRLVKGGNELPPSDYTKDLPWGGSAFEGVADTDKVLQHYRRGATIVLQALHRNWQPVATFCRHLEKRLTHSVQANAYLTPKGSQGFTPHYDTHDVLVLQVSGMKRWRLYGSPVALPHETQKFNSKTSQIGDCTSEFDLEAGDLIYIPRGYVHEGLTTDSHSLHLTIAVPALTWAEVLSQAVRACISEPEFRKSLPIGFAEQSAVGAELASKFKQLLQHFVSTVDIEATFDAVIEKYLGFSEPYLHGSIAWEELPDRIAGKTQFTRRPDVVRRVIVRDDKVALLFGGKKIEFPSFCHSSFAFIEGSPSHFCAEDLPTDIDLEGRILLLRRLFEEGYLRRIV